MSPVRSYSDTVKRDDVSNGVKVLAVSGSSAGHIFPAISLLDSFSEADRAAQTLLVVPKRVSGTGLFSCRHKVSFISTTPISAGLNLENILSGIRFLKAAAESLKIIINFKPDLVAGFGTIDTIPVVMLAFLLRIKVLLHEQNVIPGKANKLLSKFADKIALSFEGTKTYIKVSPQRIVVTGNPLRRQIKKMSRQEALGYFGFNPGCVNILVAGGSAGSSSINAAFLKVISSFAQKHKLQIIHICGRSDYPWVSEAYAEAGLSAKCFAFLKDMQYAYNACDFALCRAGAATISELIYYSMPAMLIPYPFARKHQSANAGVLEQIGAAVVINDDNLDTPGFAAALASMIVSTDKLNAMRKCYQRLPKIDAAERLFNEALKLCPGTTT